MESLLGPIRSYAKNLNIFSNIVLGLSTNVHERQLNENLNDRYYRIICTFFTQKKDHRVLVRAFGIAIETVLAADFRFLLEPR